MVRRVGLTEADVEILVVGDLETVRRLVDAGIHRGEACRCVPSLAEALQLLCRRSASFEAVVFAPQDQQQRQQLHIVLEALPILDAVPDGVALVDEHARIRWANAAFAEQSVLEDPTGADFYGALGRPEFEGPFACPITRARETMQRSHSVLARDDGRYYQVTAVPLCGGDGTLAAIIAITRDITNEVLQRQKLHAVHQAGAELADLTPDTLAEMDVKQRIELLKSQILRHTKDILQLDSIEIRLLDKATGRLDPLLCVGMNPEASQRPLYARTEGNGVTGYVAATGRSYLCQDTAHDPLYLPGAPGAKSSITVPLILHDEVIGTFNVETPQPGRFTEDDVLFLELYARDVAKALRTLELLHAEKLTAASESVELISREVSMPVDAILREATWVLDRYIGHDQELSERLRRILAAAREIKHLIQRVGEQVAPSDAIPVQRIRPPRHPLLIGKRILLADADEAVRQAAHALLERYGCTVEAVASGAEAIAMARVSPYDVFICDIRLPDMCGYDIFRALREIQPETPVILMSGFGYDPSHSIVRARRLGLTSVLYKPFRVDRLIAAIESVLTKPPCSEAPPSRRG